MAKAKFCLIIDTEADFYYKIPSPHMGKRELLRWQINKLVGKLFRYSKDRQGLVNLVKLLKKHKFPVTFNIVGHLYLKSCKGFPHFSELKPKSRWLGKNWYYWDPRSDFRKYPGLYLGDFIEKEMKTNYFTLGLHSFTHEALTLESKEVIEKAIKAGVMAAKKLGIKPKSFSPPFNMIEDVNHPNRVFAALRKNGIKVTSYVGKDDGLRILRKYNVKPVTKRFGVKCVHISNYFEGTSSRKHIREVLREIKANLGKNVVYCLATHDFTWKNMVNLRIIIRETLKLKHKGLIEIRKFGDFA